MKYHITITKTALAEINKAATYISKTLDNNIAANRLLDTAEKKINHLADNPYINPLVQDSFLAANGIRFQLVEKYIAFYVIREEKKQITVIRFLHSKRNWMSLISENPVDML